MTTAPAKPSWSRPCVGLAITLGLSAAVVAAWFLRNQLVNPLNRAALLSLQMGLEPGQPAEVVREKFRAIGNAALRLHENSPRDWFVRMPMEWGGSDWLLLVEFTDGKVSAIRVRNSDGVQPAGAPQDKVTLPPQPPASRLELKPETIRVSSLLSSC